LRWTLVRKELAEHWVVLLVLGFVAAGIFGTLALAGMGNGDPRSPCSSTTSS